MKSLTWIGCLAVTALTSAANAAVVGIVAQNYEVVDGARRFSVIDVFVHCNGQFDRLFNFYGTRFSTSMVRTSLNGHANMGNATSAGNGAAFAHAGGSGWMPSAAGAASAWDSFVTIGARTQEDAMALTSADPYFLNANASGAATIAGGSNQQGAFAGAGWYVSPSAVVESTAGTYADMCLMLGRFSVETTNLSPTDVLTLQFRGNLTMKVNGASMGTGTTVQPAFDQTFTYGFVPAPGAGLLLCAASLATGRRRAR